MGRSGSPYEADSQYTIIECLPGERYHVELYAVNWFTSIMVFDSSNKLLYFVAGTNSIVNEDVTIPEKGCKLILNTISYIKVKKYMLNNLSMIKELQSFKAPLMTYEKNVNYELIKDSYLDSGTNAHETEGYSYFLTDCIAGKKYKIHTFCNSSLGEVMFFDARNKCLNRIAGTGNYDDLCIVAPETAVKIGGNVYKAAYDSFYIKEESGVISYSLEEKSKEQLIINNKVLNEMHGYAYIADNGAIFVKSSSNDGSSVCTFEKNVNIINGSDNFFITSEKAIEQLGSNVASLDSDGLLTIKLNNGNNLVCDITDKKLKIVNRNSMTENYIPLINANYNGISGGFLMQAYFKGLIRKNKDEINDIGNRYNKLSTIESAMRSFSTAFITTTELTSFLFFTDPHIFINYINNETAVKTINTFERVFNETPTSFILCGGDWLGNSDTKDEATYKLGRIDGMMRARFNDRYYPIIGNHDTNYQGVGDDGSKNNGRLPQDTLKNLWFRDYNNMYYTFKRDTTRFYVFDTELDWYGSMSDYRYEQAEWYANELIKNDDKHSAIALHIFTNQSKDDLISSPSVQPFANQLTLIAKAYNLKSTISINEHVYDFTKTTGKVAFLICGHSHYDYNLIYNDIPIIITTDSNTTPNFDLCLADYTNGKMKMFRVGNGEDREINIIN